MEHDFIVTTSEHRIYHTQYKVKAPTAEEAERLVESGDFDADEISDELKDVTSWTVTKVEKEQQ